MKLALIEWDDAYSYGGWHEPSPERDRVARCVTIGLVLLDNDKQVTVAQNVSLTSGNVGDTLTIPRACIKRIRHLKVK